MDPIQLKKYQNELFNHFGFNYGFVFDLFEKFLKDQSSVSEYWKNYFTKLINNGSEIHSDKISETKTIEVKAHKTAVQKISTSFEMSEGDELITVSGGAGKIIENMNNSLSIPTATSLKTISVKLLEENRIIINDNLLKIKKSKISFSHVVAYAIVQALKEFPALNNSFAFIDDKPTIIKKNHINIGVAVDLQKKDGSRSLIVPNIKRAEKMNFEEFSQAYDVIIAKSRSGKIEPADFQGTTITMTNPGGIGTVSSTPRLLNGQGVIIAVGAIDYPSEFQAMHTSTLAAMGIGKVMNITSTYDHRIIQGAESGMFLSRINDFLLGKNNFYESIFADLRIPQKPVPWGIDASIRDFGDIPNKKEIEKQAKVLQLINSYRVRAHLMADLNPLEHNLSYWTELDPHSYGFTIWDYDRVFITGGLKGLETGTLREIISILRQTYCDRLGVEYMHIQNPEEKMWLQSMMEPISNKFQFSAEFKKRIMEKLIVAEAFEHFLHTRFVGHKRFSLEGSETVVPVLDYIMGLAAEDNVCEIVMGMAHRGRLNVLSNIIGKSYEDIFSEFNENINEDAPQGTGDVKYHLGATGLYKTFSSKEIRVTLSANPSHLEWVNPVVEGIVRAKQTRIKDKERKSVIPVLIHGDAAFAGQGVVAETLNLSQLIGYTTGGTIHIIINNQIGFTTLPEDARSSPYATDVAKMVQAPIFHVNGDHPESALWAAHIAYQYRQIFKKDVVIDLFGYRRHGHNEGDDPVYTQPLLYKKIKEQPSVKQLYEKKLIEEKLLTPKELKELDESIYNRLDEALKESKKKVYEFKVDTPLAVTEDELKSFNRKKETKVPIETLIEVVKGITKFPENFALNPKLKKHIDKRKELLTGRARIDWAFAEALAFGTLLLENVPVRLSGQDSARGTFSHRHLVYTDMNNGLEFTPHNHITESQAKIEALDSLLSEAAVLGYEYGISIADPLSLTLWEAQFGDFANGAQIIIDNFIVSSYIKWLIPTRLVLLLPHGYEGQGPEHSSARLERFLTLSAENNMYVCNLSTPAQYFHALRRQVYGELSIPLVIMSPKSLLRLPAARSLTDELTNGNFEEFLDDSSISDTSNIKRILLCSGKIYYELNSYRELNKISDTAIIRIEQFYPFNSDKLKNILDKYSSVKSIVWVQEEPQNMGAWNFLFPRLLRLVGTLDKLHYAGRAESPSPASGSFKIYQYNQEKLVREAFEK